MAWFHHWPLRREERAAHGVQRLFKLHDVGFSQAVQGAPRAAADGLGRDKLGIEEQLRYRYLLSLEGNDVATDLVVA